MYRLHHISVLCLSLLLAVSLQARSQTETTTAVETADPVLRSQLDFFVGADLHYRDIKLDRMYDFLIYLTPGVKWHFGRNWQMAAQGLIPVINQYGDYYKRVRLNMAVLSKEVFIPGRAGFKFSGGLFGMERYGLDVKGRVIATNWLSFQLQAGLTGFCSMAVDWKATAMKRVSAVAGANIYLPPWNTELQLRGGRFIFEDYGAVAEAMRHFKHCTVGLYAQYSNKGGKNGGFKVIMMIPPYKRKRRPVNIRPASNFRLTYNIEADPYANRMYTTDPEENEREGWFSRDQYRWGSNTMDADFKYRRP